MDDDGNDDSVSSRRRMIVPSVSGGSRDIIEPPPLRRGQSQDRPRSFAETQSLFKKDVVVIAAPAAHTDDVVAPPTPRAGGAGEDRPPHPHPHPAPSPRQSFLPLYYKPSYYKDKNNNKSSNSTSIKNETTTTTTTSPLPVLPVPHVARSAMTAYKAGANLASSAMKPMPSYYLFGYYGGCNDSTAAADQVLKSEEDVTCDSCHSTPSRSVVALKDYMFVGGGCNDATAAEQVLKSEDACDDDDDDSIDSTNSSVTDNDERNRSRNKEQTIPRITRHQISQEEEGHNHGFEVTLLAKSGEQQEGDDDDDNNNNNNALRSNSTKSASLSAVDDDDNYDNTSIGGPVVVENQTATALSSPRGGDNGDDPLVVCNENNVDGVLSQSKSSRNLVKPSSPQEGDALFAAAYYSSKFPDHGNKVDIATSSTTNRALLSSDLNQPGVDHRHDTVPDVVEVSSNPKNIEMLSRRSGQGGSDEESPLKSKRRDRSLPTTWVGRKQENVDNISVRWTRLVSKIHRPVLLVLQWLSQSAVHNPIRTIVYITALSIALTAIGLATNFTYTVDETIMWTPFGTPTESQRDWIEAEWGTSQGVRPFVIFLHGDGRDILGQNPVAHLFEALDRIRNLDGYDDVCNMSPYIGPDGKNACKIHGAVQFWNSTTAIFQQEVASDEDAILAMSTERYPNNVPVYEYEIFGYPQRNATNQLLTSVISYTVVVNFPYIEESKALEEDALDAILQLRDTWASDPDIFLRLEAVAERTFSDEFTRAIVDDLYLIPIAFVMLCAFTAFAFSRRHKVYSRCLLGIGAVITCLLSIATTYGLLMICGVPVTTATQMLPFVVMGIGLDDAFIIMGSFTRNGTKDIAECVRQTIDDIGVSIFLTSLTSSLAFALGCFSNVPTIYWMSLYAFPMIIIDFIYQITFFVALLVLDERRIQQNRRDVCTWITVPTYSGPQRERIASAGVRSTCAHGGAHDVNVQSPDKTMSRAIENTAEERYIMVPLSPPRDDDEDCDLASQEATMGHYENEQTPHEARQAEKRVENNTNFETQLFDSEQATNAALSSHGDEAQQSDNEDLGGASLLSYEAKGLPSRLRSARVEKQAMNTASMSIKSEEHQLENQPPPAPIESDNSRSYEIQQMKNETSSLPSSTMRQTDNSSQKSTSSNMEITASASKDRTDLVADRLMVCYGEYLMRPWVKALVILGFCLLAAMGSLSASKLTQKFEFTNLMPDDSYAIDFFDAIQSYSLQATVSPYVYFRDVDQSDQDIQQQMGEYVVDLVLGVDAIVLGPNAFWLRDFHDYVEFAGIHDLDFNAQLDQFLNVPVLFEMYSGDIIRDENGTLISSRCLINMVNMPKVDHLQESIEALHQQRAVTMEQPINNGSPDGPFFTYGMPYNIWEFYAICVNELTMTMVMGVIAVSIISIFFVPHWTAVFYVTPLVCILNVELLGVLQWAGMYVNAITYITVFMAVGFFVDYIMHVLFKYYESAGNRREKTLEMLSTMGTSILLGGLSTLLGTVPLIFSSSGIFYTVFVTAMGIVFLGLGHGLILLPVLLSIFGTEDQVIIQLGNKEY